MNRGDHLVEVIFRDGEDRHLFLHALTKAASGPPGRSIVFAYVKCAQLNPFRRFNATTVRAKIT
jgi:hypothetical protein